MDYTTIERVKQEMHIDTAVSGSSADDGLLATLITSASRAWDRMCTGVPDAVDYFKTETMTDEILRGQIDSQGQAIICYPHKPIIFSVSSFSYQSRIIDPVYAVDPTRIDISGPRIIAYPDGMPLEFPSQCRVTLSYNGGVLASGSVVSGLPADMVEAVTILVARFYREAESGLTDQIGVAEFSTMIYTKSWPVRVTNTAEFYKRKVGWRHVA